MTLRLAFGGGGDNGSASRKTEQPLRNDSAPRRSLAPAYLLRLATAAVRQPAALGFNPALAISSRSSSPYQAKRSSTRPEIAAGAGSSFGESDRGWRARK